MEQIQNNEVLELLPISIANSNNFSTKCKYLIANLLFLNGLDKVKNDGYFFRTNRTLANESNMTEANLLINLRKLESLKFISRKAGKRGEASEYRIDENAINSYVEVPTKVKKYAIAKSNNSNNNNSNNCNSDNDSNSNKIDNIILKINELENILLIMRNTIDKIYHYCNSNNSNSTDTESDIESETDIIYKLNNNINLNIGKIKTDLKKEVEANETSFECNSNKTNNSDIPTEEINNINLEKEEVEIIETSSDNQNKIDSYIPIETKNDMKQEIIRIDNSMKDTNTTNDSIDDFKAAGTTLIDNPAEVINKTINVENNVLECIVSTKEKEIDTAQLDIDKLCSKIDYILDIARYCNEGSLPIDNIENAMLFISELENKCYTEISIYFYNDRIINEGKEYLLNKMEECKKTIEYLFQQLDKFDNFNNDNNSTELDKTSSEIITIEESITIVSSSNSDNNSNKIELDNNPIDNITNDSSVNDFKATGITFTDISIEDTNECTNIESNTLICVISTTEENNNKYTIDKSSNSNNKINNSNKDMKEFNIETPIGFIQFINQQFENNKITKEEYKREIDFYKRNYFNAYNSIKELVLPIAA